jgi:hypothetical protein
MRILIGDPLKIAKKSNAHPRNFVVVDTVLASLPGPKVDRDVFPSQIRLPLQRDSQRDILKIDITRDASQRRAQRTRADKAIRHVRVAQKGAAQQPKQQAVRTCDCQAAKAIVSGPAIAENAVVLRALAKDRLEKRRIALSVRIDLKNPAGRRSRGHLIALAAGAPVPGVRLVHNSQPRAEIYG